MLSLSLDSERRIDGVCVRFEEAWRRGGPVNLAEYLEGFRGPEYQLLLLELLLLDCWYRNRQGCLLPREEYQAIFPNDADVVARAFCQFEVSLASHASVDSDTPPQGMTLPLPGREFGKIGNYVILEQIARGGMGVVYKARQNPLGREVALKMMVGGRFHSEESLGRFRREAKAAASLSHPNIVAVHEVGSYERVPYFSMDYIQGGSLARLLRDGPLGARDAALIIAEVASAVHYAHRQGTLHRDLKPSNILIDTDGSPVVTDFGLAKSLHLAAENSLDELTSTGQILGTPSFMSPEQAAGNHDQVGPATDVYSLGAVLYACLSGRPPFVADQPLDTLLQVVRNEPVPPCMLNSSVPRDLETICLKCLSKDPQHRYRSADELAEDLRRFLDHRPVLARPLGPGLKTYRWAKRNPIVAALVVICFISLIAGTIISAYFASDAERQAAKWKLEKNKAEAAADRERKLRRDLRTSLGEVETQRRRAEWNAYRLLMRSMNTAFREGHFGKLETLVDGFRPQDAANDDRGWEWYFFRNQVARRSTVRESDRSPYQLVRLNSEGQLVAIRREDGDLDICDGITLECLRTLPGAGQKFCAWKPNENLLAVATDANFVDLWDASTGELRASVKTPDDVTNMVDRALVWNRDGTQLALGGDQRVDLFGGDGEHQVTLRSCPVRVRRMAWHPDGSKLAVTCESGVAVIDVPSDSTQWLFRGGDTLPTDLAWDNQGRRLATAWEDNQVRVFDANGDQRTLQIENSSNFVCWSKEGYLLIAVRNHGIQCWDADLKTLNYTLLVNATPIISLHTNTHSGDVATVEADGRVRRFKLDPVSQPDWQHDLSPTIDALRRLERCPHNDDFLACQGPHRLAIVDLPANGKADVHLLGNEGETIASFAWHPFEPTIATVSEQGGLALWNARTAEQIVVSSSAGSQSQSRVIAWNADGTLLAVSSPVASSGAAVGSIEIRRGTSFELVCRIDSRSHIEAGAWSPNGIDFAAHSVDDGGSMRVFRLHEGLARIQTERTNLAGRMSDLRYSPQGDRIALAGERGIIHIIDAQTGAEIHRTPLALGPVQQLDWAEDGSRILCSHVELGLTLLDSNSGDVLLEFDDADDLGNHGCWRLGGQQIVTGSRDGRLRIWDGEPDRRDVAISSQTRGKQ